MSVKARMRCHHVREWRNQDGSISGKSVELSPVYSSDKNDPNYSYSQATPSGSIQLSITNPAAYDQFVENKVYDLCFEEYIEPAKGD